MNPKELAQKGAGGYEIDNELSDLLARTPLPSLKELLSTMRGDVRVVMREKFRDSEPTFKGKHAYEWFNDRLGVSTLKDREVLMKGLVRLGYLKVIAEDVATPLKSRYAFLTPTADGSRAAVKWSDSDSNRMDRGQPSRLTTASPDPRMKMSQARETRAPLPIAQSGSALVATVATAPANVSALSPRQQTPPPGPSASPATSSSSTSLLGRATVAPSGSPASGSNSALFAPARPKNDTRGSPLPARPPMQPLSMGGSSGNLNLSAGSLAVVLGSTSTSTSASASPVHSTGTQSASASNSSLPKAVPPIGVIPSPGSGAATAVSPVPQSSSSLLLHALPVHKSPRSVIHPDLPILGAAREADLGINVFSSSHSSATSASTRVPSVGSAHSASAIPDLQLPASPKVPRSADSPTTTPKEKRSKKEKKDKADSKKEKKKDKSSSLRAIPSPREADSLPKQPRPLSEAVGLEKPFASARAVPVISSQRAGGGAVPALGKYSPRTANTDDGCRLLYLLECEIYAELDAAWKGPCGTLSDILPGLYSAKAVLATMPQLRVFHERLVHDLENRLPLLKAVARLCDSTFLKWYTLYIASNQYANELISVHRTLLESRSVDVALLHEFVNRPCKHLQRLSFTLGRTVDAQRGAASDVSAKLAAMLLPLTHTLHDIERRTAGSDPLVWDLHQRLGGKVPLLGAHPPLRMILSARCVSGDVEQHIFLLDQMLVIARMESPPALVHRQTLQLFELDAKDLPDSPGVQNVIELKPTAEDSAVITLNFSSQVEKDAWAHRLPNLRRVLRIPVEF